jgi:uncharacterized protein
MSIREFVDQLPIYDVHEHHMPDTFLNRDVGLLDLLRQSYAGWTQERPYPLPSEGREEDPMLGASAETTWEKLAAFVEDSGSNHFVRNLVRGLDELYELGGIGITRDNWRDLDREIRVRHQSPDWAHEVMRRAGVKNIITDPYAQPLLDARSGLGDHYRSVMRINGLAMGWHPKRRDHNGNGAPYFAETLGVKCESFEDFCALLETAVDTLKDRNQVALKNALAYDRDIQFDEPDEAQARNAWQNPNASPAEQKAFGDFVVDRLCSLAGERDVPVQMHLGTAIIRGSHPLKAAGLIERHPKTRFLLMHLAYPWSTDLLGMAFVYRNIWIDLTWSFLLSPSHFKRAFHEAIELLPDEGRMMLGGDNWHAEESFSTFRTARGLVAEVLQEKLDHGYFSPADAERLAKKIFVSNAESFFAVRE